MLIIYFDSLRCTVSELLVKYLGQVVSIIRRPVPNISETVHLRLQAVILVAIRICQKFHIYIHLCNGQMNNTSYGDKHIIQSYISQARQYGILSNQDLCFWI